jgi:hypothetical protein
MVEAKITTPTNAKGTSWRVQLLPFLGEQVPQLIESYDESRAWDASPNSRLALHKIRSYSCPAVYVPADPDGRWFTAYTMVDPASQFRANQPGNLPDDLDLRFVEAVGSRIIWPEPRDTPARLDKVSVDHPTAIPGLSFSPLSSYHVGGPLAVTSGGRVFQISKSIDPILLKKMLSGEMDNETPN